MPDDHPATRRLPPWVAPWRLELGRIDEHRLAIEHAGREVALCFEAPVGESSLSPSRIALVQPSTQIELPLPPPSPVRSLRLPWVKAPLDDLWLLVCAAGRRCWLEVPYGVCRPPGEQREPPQLGPPRHPPGEAPGDLVLPWEAIRFELGHAGGWELAVHARRAHAGEIELVAGRAEPGVPPPIALAASAGTRALSLEEQAPWSDEPASLHAARYRFPPPPLLGMRAYVRLTAKCGSQALALDLPTSLTDPSHRSFEQRKATP
jgi:hypothetical protein